MEQYISLIEFRILDPEAFIRIWNKDFEIKEYIIGKQAQL
jgi:hypothetical protein